MSSKKLASALAAALALATADAHAQDGFLNTLGKGLLKTAQEAGTATKRPPGILGAYYWDDGDPQVLDGYTRLRWGLTATLDAGALTCEELLFAQEKAGQPMTASTRERCLGTWNAMSAKAGQKGGGEGAFEARRREIAAADRFYLRPRIQTTIGNDGVLHAYVYLLSESWYPDSPGFIPRAAVRGDRRGIHDLPHGGKYHAAIRLSPADAQDLQRAGRDLAGDRIFFRLLKGSLQANGLPSFVLEIDRLEVGFQGQVVGITPSQSRGNLEGRVQGSGS